MLQAAARIYVWNILKQFTQSQNVARLYGVPPNGKLMTVKIKKINIRDEPMSKHQLLDSQAGFYYGTKIGDDNEL